jgi:DNA-binding response OmpR family regulator
VRRLLVVEDEADIREGLADFFTGRGFQVEAVATAEEASEQLSAATFTAVLLDLQLPGADGLDVLRGLRARGDDTPVLVVTARGAEPQRVDGLELGADDYVLKPFSVRELAARLDAVLRRAPARRATCRIGAATVDLDALEVRRGEGPPERLLQKEAELLAHLLRHAGRVLTREELLRDVWGFDRYPTTRTVDTHVFQLRKKLETEPEKPRHLLTVHGVGYRLVVEG